MRNDRCRSKRPSTPFAPPLATCPSSEFRGDTRVVVPAEKIYEVLKLLKEKHGFDLLVDVTCVDYLNYPGAKDRFGLVYLLAGTVRAPLPCGG